MSNRRKLRLVGGRFAEREAWDPLQNAFGEIWRFASKQLEGEQLGGYRERQMETVSSPLEGLLDLEWTPRALMNSQLVFHRKTLSLLS